MVNCNNLDTKYGPNLMANKNTIYDVNCSNPIHPIAYNLISPNDPPLDVTSAELTDDYKNYCNKIFHNKDKTHLFGIQCVPHTSPNAINIANGEYIPLDSNNLQKLFADYIVLPSNDYNQIKPPKLTLLQSQIITLEHQYHKIL